MAVVVILGVLAALALPNYNIQIKKTKNREAIQVLLALYGAQKDYAQEHDDGNSGTFDYTNDLTKLDITIDSLKNFKEPIIVNAELISCNGDSFRYVASMEEINGNYTLYVLQDEASINEAKIICSVNRECPATLCTQMGF